MVSILKNLFWMSLGLSLAACSNSGFTLQEEEAAQLDVSGSLDSAEQSQFSKLLVFNSFKYKQSSLTVKGQKIELKAQLSYQNKSLGLVELEGEFESSSSEALLRPKDRELKSWLGAKISCLDETVSGSLICTQYHITFMGRQGGKIYLDQFLKSNFPTQPSFIQPEPSPETSAGTSPSEFSEFEVLEDAVPVYEGSYEQDRADGKIIEELELPQNGGFPINVNQVHRELFNEPLPGEQPGDQSREQLKENQENNVVAEQAIGFPTNGSLKNGFDILSLRNSFPRIFYDAGGNTLDHFGVTDMGKILTLMAEVSQKLIPDFEFQTNGVAMRNGGLRRPSVSHQTGLDADLNFVTSDSKKSPFKIIVGLVPVVKRNSQGEVIERTKAYQGPVHPSFQAKEQWELIKAAFSTGRVNGMLLDRQVKKELCKVVIASGELTSDANKNAPAFKILSRIKHAANHHHHIHMRIRCPKGTTKCGETLPNFALTKSECF